MLNLATILDEPARRRGGHPAFVIGEARLSYGTVQALASRVAGALRAAGIRPGDRVALTCPNLPWFPVCYFGILMAGAVVVPLNVLFKRREIAYHLDDSGAVAHLCFQGTPELPVGEEAHAALAHAPACRTFVLITPRPDDPSPREGVPTLGAFIHPHPAGFVTEPTRETDTALILYTSGTTGQPKGAELTHHNLFMNAFLTRELLRYTAEDVGLGVLPLFHSFGQTVVMNAMILAGGCTVLLPRFEPAAALLTMQREGVTVFSGVPTMYFAMMQAATDGLDLERIRARLRLAVSGGAALPLEVLRGFEAKFGVPILEGYGLSETSPVACFNQLDAERRVGTIGTPVWGVDMRIGGPDGTTLPDGRPGELLIRGHNIMKGYWNRPGETAEAVVDGWLRTGDIGIREPDGYFRIVDRSKDMIIRGGFNVYPREVEEVLLTHPAIALAAVVGLPDPALGEEIRAFVVLRPGVAATPEEIVAWSRSVLASYKYPRSVVIRDALPMNATGKILKTELRKD
ncbi:MAG: long-chain fatty acid--CoA ligase [Kiritimatiellia bacterium]